MPQLRVWLVLVFVFGAAAFASVRAQGTWQPARQFSDREGPALAYDPVRDRIVMFGGFWGHWSAYGTWEWDGKSWARRRSANTPSPRCYAEMVWDPNTGKILLFGGANRTAEGRLGTYLNDTWLWDGQDWQQVFPKNRPSPRTIPCLALDPLRKRPVLFGGYVGYKRVIGDTWEWDGSDWIQKSPQNSPPAKGAAGFAFHPRSRRMLLAGGTDGTISGPPRDYWEWDGVDWRKLAAPPSPTFHGASAVTDPFTGDVFLWAMEGEPSPKSTLWRWDGQSWNAVNVAFGHRAGKIVADPVRQRIHAVPWPPGVPPLHPVQSTWEFDGQVWRKAWQQTWPKGDAFAAYDSSRQEFLVWIEEISRFGVMWTYRPEKGWRKLSMPKTMPSMRTRPHLLSLGSDGPIILFGGHDGYVNLSARDVFVWNGADWSKTVFPIAPVSGGQAAVDPDRKLVYYYHGVVPELWELDLNKGWRKLPAISPPPARIVPKICYDSARGRLILHGGALRNPYRVLTDTWEWDGQTWTKMVPAQYPPPRNGGTLVHVPALGGVLLQGGSSTQAPHAPLGDSWLWDGSNWTQMKLTRPGVPFPTIPGESPSSYALDTDRQRLCAFFRQGPGGVWYLETESLQAVPALPRPGESVSFRFAAPRVKGGWGLVALALGPYPGVKLPPLPGLHGVLPLAWDPLLQQSLGFGLIGSLDKAGAGTVPFAIPNDKRLEGFRFEAAGLLFDASAQLHDATNSVTIEVVR